MELVLRSKELSGNAKICYQHISSHYWYATYGHFSVVMHKESGYINVTRLCKIHKKSFKNWHANKHSRLLINGLAEKLTITPEKMLVAIVGGSGKSKAVICGTYAHPILLPHIVSWIDSTFAAIVSIMVNTYFQVQTETGDLDVLLQDKKLQKAPKEAKKDGDARNGASSAVKLKKVFKIFKRLDDKYPYQAFEVPPKAMDAAVLRFQLTDAGTNDLLLEIDHIPQGVSLYNLLKSAGLIQTNRNMFKSQFPLDTLLIKIKELSWENATCNEWFASEVITISDDEL